MANDSTATIKVQREGILIPWNLVPPKLLRALRLERRFESFSSQVLERQEVTQVKISRQLKEALGRILALCQIAPVNEAGAEALADVLDELGETPKGIRALRKMMEG